MSAKKIFIIVLILFVLAGSSLVVYNFFLKNKEGPAPRNGDSNGKSLNLKVKPISQERVFAPVVDEDNQTIKYYLRTNGYVFKSAFDGSGLEPISTVNLTGLTKIIWSPDKKKVIGFFEKQGTINKYVYDYQAKTNTPLDENVRAIAWSPDSQKIVYQYQSPDGSANNISIANPDGSAWRNIFQTRLQDLVVEWPSPDKISLRNKPSGLALGFLFTLDPQTGNFNKIFDNLYGFSAKWSGNSQKILYQTTDQKGKNLKLYVAQADGSQAKELPLETLVEKCVWAEDDQRLFCAVPQTLSENAVWPDDYFLGRLAVKDDIYLIDLTSNQKTKIAVSDGEQTFDAAELLLSAQEDYLFFINRKDGLLYSLKLELK